MNVPKDLHSLKRKLEIGDIEQIRELNVWRNRIEKKEEWQRKVDAGEIKRYRIEIEYRGRNTIELWAEHEQDAKDKAYFDAEDPFDFEIESMNVEEIKET